MSKLDDFHPYVHMFRVHAPKLLNETFYNAIRPIDLNTLRIPLTLFQKYLTSIAKRSIELNDPVLNKLMIDMTLYEQSDPSSDVYSQDMVDEVNRAYNKFIDEQ